MFDPSDKVSDHSPFSFICFKKKKLFSSSLWFRCEKELLIRSLFCYLMQRPESEDLNGKNPDGVSSEETHKKTCADCGTTKTPLWRGGPAGPKVIVFAHFPKVWSDQYVLFSQNLIPFFLLWFCSHCVMHVGSEAGKRDEQFWVWTKGVQRIENPRKAVVITVAVGIATS